MARFARGFWFVLQAAIAGLALAFVVTRLWPDRFAAANPSAPVDPTPATTSYAAAVAHALPAVVNIYTRRLVTRQPQQSLGDPALDRLAGISPFAPLASHDGN